MSASTPPGGVTIEPGGSVELPLTVRNDGDAESEPVEATLSLPDGIRSAGFGGGGGTTGGAAARHTLAAGQGQEAATVRCPQAEGASVTCRSGAGLAPGESVVLLFRLVADDDVRPGSAITATVNAGGGVPVEVTVPVSVPDQAEDGVDLMVEERQPGWGWWPWTSLRAEVHNSGETNLPVTIAVDSPAHATEDGFTCGTGGQLRCESNQALEPGESRTLTVYLDDWPSVWSLWSGQAAAREVTVTATIGQARQTRTVRLERRCCHWPGLDPGHRVTGRPTTTTPSPEPAQVPPPATTTRPSPPVVTSTDPATPTDPTTTTPSNQEVPPPDGPTTSTGSAPSSSPAETANGEPDDEGFFPLWGWWRRSY
jgi:hypothetical protein